MKKAEISSKNEFSIKFLTFYLAAEEYGIEITKVNEIIGMMAITSIPGMPHYMCGIINLRGRIIPIVDLRLKFGMEWKERTAETCIIVVSLTGIQIGIIVDRVSEVLDIHSADIEDAPTFRDGVDTGYILGIGKSQNKVRILLSIDAVLSNDEHGDLLAMQTAEAQPLFQ